MALRYLTTFSALLATVLARDTSDPSPLKNANLLLTPGLLPARPLLGRSNNPFESLLLGVTGRLLRHANLEDRVCGGSALHSACPNDVTKCCPTGGDCCGDGTCCENGHVCQKNHLGRSVCCLKGRDCSLRLPINPCAIATHAKCAGFDACCPPNHTCQLVGDGITCVGPPSGGGRNVLAKRQQSSSGMVSGGSGSGPTSSPPQVTSVLQAPSSSQVRPPSSAQPPSSSAPPAQPPSSSISPPSSSIAVRPPSSSAPVRPPSSTTPPSVTRPPSTVIRPQTVTSTKPAQTMTRGNTPSSPSIIIKTQSPSAPAPSATDRNPPSFAQTISQTRLKEASTITRGGTVITIASTVVVVPGDGDGSTPTAPTTIVGTSIMTSAVVSDGATSYVEIPIVTTWVLGPEPAGGEPTTTPTGGSSGSSDGKSGPKTAVIAGASIGGTVLLAAIIFGVVLLAKKKKTRRKEHPDFQGIFTPQPVREPTIPVLPPPPSSSGAGGRGSTASPVSELSSRGVVAPVPRYGSMYVPPDVPELQENAVAREGNGAAELSDEYTIRTAQR
ncbi:hypothetical protein HOY80DRAFT_879301 [Tuber brumale]|nr:hypothetical protein HOY80DRAFT_879301 [Tuber brumale]